MGLYHPPVLVKHNHIEQFCYKKIQVSQERNLDHFLVGPEIKFRVILVDRSKGNNNPH